MAELDRNIIKNLASDSLVYSRGLRYYKNKAIKTISKSKTKSRYRATVSGKSEYTVDIDLTGKEPIFQCNCPASRKYPKACKHSVAVMLFINDYIDKSKQNRIVSDDRKRVARLLDYFDKMDYLNSIGELFHLKLQIKVPAILKKDSDARASICFYAGSKRLYKIQQIRKFLLDYMNGETILIGKDFAYYPGESRFDSPSIPVLDFFIELLKIQEMVGKGNSSVLFNRAEVYLDKHLLLRLLKLVQQPFLFSTSGEEYDNVSFKQGSPDLNFYLNLSDEEDAILLSWDEGEIIPLDDKGSLFFYDHIIYHPPKLFSKHFLPFYSLAQDKTGESLIFEGEEKKQFLYSVLPRIHETFHLTIPNSLKNNYITEEAVFTIFLDVEANKIKLHIMVNYGGYEFNPFNPPPTENVVIVRQPAREADCIELIEYLGFVKDGDSFYLSEEEAIYAFLMHKIEDLKKEYDVLCTKSFLNMNVSRPKILKTSVRVKEDNRFLEIDFDFEGVSKEEIHHLFQSLKLKKKYYRLKNGSFIDLSNYQDISMIEDLFDGVSSTEDYESNGLFYTSSHQALYIEQLHKMGRYNIDMDQSFQNLIQDIYEPTVEDSSIPQTIKALLRPYQQVGVQWLCSLSKYHLSGILADDMGLGKTLQAITYMAKVLETQKDATFLVVCPSSLLYNWEEEIHHFCPSLTSAIILGNPEDRKEILAEIKKYQIILISYPIIRRDIEELISHSFHTVFLDEAQFIKNPNSRNAKAVKALRSLHRFALTGTPIENNLSELWSIFDFLMPGYLLSHSKFINHYEKPIVKYNNDKVLETLSFKIKPFILRRMKKDVLRELPEKIEKKIITDMTDRQKELYLSYLSDIKSKINNEIQRNGFEKSRIMILASLTRLRQICCHPSTFVENFEGDSGKLNLLLQILENGLANGNRILIFSQFTSMLKLIEKELLKRAYPYFYLDGNTSIPLRNQDVKSFNAGEKEIYLVSLKAGGTGLNLVGADMVIHFDPWWNPAVEEQATDRVYRIGQTKSVTVIKLLTKGTIEEKIYKLQEKKKHLADSVIQSGEIFLNKLTREEVEDLFTY